MRKSMLSLEFWGAKKEPPEAQKQEFVLSLEFLAAKWAFLGSPGGEKSTFTTCLSRIYKQPKKPQSRLDRGGPGGAQDGKQRTPGPVTGWFWGPGGDYRGGYLTRVSPFCGQFCSRLEV